MQGFSCGSIVKDSHLTVQNPYITSPGHLTDGHLSYIISFS